MENENTKLIQSSKVEIMSEIMNSRIFFENQKNQLLMQLNIKLIKLTKIKVVDERTSN